MAGCSLKKTRTLHHTLIKRKSKSRTTMNSELSVQPGANFRPYKCDHCLLLQIVTDSATVCEYCGKGRPYLKLVQWRDGYPTRSDYYWDPRLILLPSCKLRRRRNCLACWQKCKWCNTVQCTSYKVCQYCLAKEVTVPNPTIRHPYPTIRHPFSTFRNQEGIRRLCDVHKKCKLKPLSTTFQHSATFITQQETRKATGLLWSTHSIFPLDGWAAPGVNPNRLLHNDTDLTPSESVQTNLQQGTQVTSRVRSAPSVSQVTIPTSRQVAPSSRPSRTASKVRNFSMQETAEAIDKLADLLDPSRHTVRKILQQDNPKDYFWECQQCSFHNCGDIRVCDICEVARVEALLLSDSTDLKDKNEEESSKQLVGQAVDSIQCPICLDVFNTPITLPCGHSVCVCHAPRLKKKCPVCRHAFSSTDAAMAKNKALCKNIKNVVELARLADPDRETIRNAYERLQEK